MVLTNDQLHEFRRNIDVCILVASNSMTCKEGESCEYNREMEIATIKLQEAKMWVGKCRDKSRG